MLFRSVQYPGGTLLYISGTAAIRSEDSLSGADAATQTRITLENINALTAQTGGRIFSARIYVKYPADNAAVRPIVEAHYPDAELLFVKAEVCRPELLVEIEAAAWTANK